MYWFLINSGKLTKKETDFPIKVPSTTTSVPDRTSLIFPGKVDKKIVITWVTSSDVEFSNTKPTQAKRDNVKAELNAGFSNYHSTKKILEKFFTNEAVRFSLNETLIVNGTDTNVKASDFGSKLWLKNGCFDEQTYPINTNVLDLNPILVKNQNAYENEARGWIDFSFWANTTQETL